MKVQLPQDLEILHEFLGRMGMWSIANLDPQDHGKGNLKMVLLSMLFSGQAMTIPDSDIMLYSHPGDQFLERVHQEFTDKNVNPYYHLTLMTNFMRFFLRDLMRIDSILNVNHVDKEGKEKEPDDELSYLIKGDHYYTVSNKIKQSNGRMFDRNFNHEELLLSFKDYLGMRIYESDDDENIIQIFEQARRKMGINKGVFEDLQEIAFITFSLEVAENGEDGSRSGYILSYNGAEPMPSVKQFNFEEYPSGPPNPMINLNGIEVKRYVGVKRSNLYLDQSHELHCRYFPRAQGPNIDKDTTFHAERKIILILDELLNNVEIRGGTIRLYSEKFLCDSCRAMIAIFEELYDVNIEVIEGFKT